MKQKNILLAVTLFAFSLLSFAQEESNYIEFNDRKNVVHGVYLGLTSHCGEMNNKDTYLTSLKVAYVANRKVEVGFVATIFYSKQNYYNKLNGINEDIVGGYGGLHVEPILFSKYRINLSFPILIGVGGLGVIDSDFKDKYEDIHEDNINESDTFGVIEPGLNLLFNVSRYVQLEAGVKYWFSSLTDLKPASLNRINGFSAGFGIKIGVFNMGRNRYKKKL